MQIKLFCFPYAGGSCSFYQSWRPFLAPSVLLFPIELAGRGKRFKEPLFYKIEDMVDDLYLQIKEEITDTSFAFFGHSLGSLIVFELAMKLQKLQKDLPKHLFLSGKNAPHLNNSHLIDHNLPDDEIIKNISNLGGTTEEIFENNEYRKLFLPIVKADLEIYNTYRFNTSHNPLNIDFSIFCGKNDPLLHFKRIHEWKKLTNKSCMIYEFPGNHMYLLNQQAGVVKIINRILSEA